MAVPFVGPGQTTRGVPVDIRPFLLQQLNALTAKTAKATPDTFGKPTPCAKFDVKALLNHVIGGQHMFAEIANGKTFEMPTSTPDLVGDDPKTAMEGSNKLLTDALNGPGVLDRQFAFPFGAFPAAAGIGIMMMETVVHTWDLCAALDLDATIDPMIAGMMLQNLKNGGFNPAFREGDNAPFGSEITVPDTATPTEKLVAFLGRTP